MNILFMCLGTFDNLDRSSVHIDLLKRFAAEHDVWLVCKHEGQRTEMSEEQGIHVLRVHTGSLKKVGLIRKGLNTVLVEPQFTNAVRHCLRDVHFDLVLYTTPPITFASAVRYIRKRDGALTYLMLKDIFPQNAVDLGMMPVSGARGFLYRYFRRKEKQLYSLSDYIGCMSPANVDYLLHHNPEVRPERAEVCPNITVAEDKSVDEAARQSIRNKYGIPLDKKVFVYGGNLGKPQDIPFLIQCLKAQHPEEAFFLVIGQGTEYGKLQQFMEKEAPADCRLMSVLPVEDYETLVAACDVGMIFLDHRFTIPNFPSRILSYMKAKVPVLSVTDPNTDIGRIAEENGFGWWCESRDPGRFTEILDTVLQSDLPGMGEKGFEYLMDHYTTDKAYEIIMKHVL